MAGATVTLTTAQAIVRYLDAQFIAIDGVVVRLTFLHFFNLYLSILSVYSVSSYQKCL